MTRRRLLPTCVQLSFVFAFFIGTPLAAATLTGSWSGNGTASWVCHYNDTSGHTISVPMSGAIGISLSLLQSGGAVNGSITLSDVPDEGNQCRTTGVMPPLSGPVSGSGSGSSFTLTAILPKEDGQAEPFSLSATLDASGNSLAIGGAGTDISSNTTLSGSLARTSSDAPDSQLSGTWSGSFTETFLPCGKLAPLTFSATLSLSLLQSGTSLFGNGTVSNGKQDNDATGTCVVSDTGPFPFSLLAEISGSSVTGHFISPGDDVFAFQATLSGTTMTGTRTDPQPGQSMTFTLTRTGTGTPPQPPSVISFTADPPTISSGLSSTLSWATTNATSVSIDNGVGGQSNSGTTTVSPKQTTTYTLTALGAGVATASTTVTVNTAGPPNVVVSAFPSGMLQLSGGGNAGDSFSLTNSGSGDAVLTIAAGGNFFQVSPGSLTLASGATQQVSISSTQQSAGEYEGTATVSGSGTGSGLKIPVRLLVAGPPSGTVLPQPSAARVDVSAPAGQNPTGSVSFTNNGTAALQALAVSDSPWLVPQTGAVNVAPGQSQSISFSVDRSQRPDGAAPLGGVSGKVSLVYFSGPPPPSALIVSQGTTPTSTVSVTIVDLVPPGVTNGAPPPLKQGELALFAQGLRNNSRAAGDLFFSSRNPAGASVSDLKIYTQVATSSAQSAAVPQFAANVGIAFPAILKNVFNAVASGLSLQFRGSDVGNLAVAGIVSSSSADGLQTFASSFPVLRSDRGTAPGQRLVVSGIDRVDDATDPVTSTLVVQEVSGNSGSVHVEYRDVHGTLVSSGSSGINGFSVISDEVPAAAAAAIITNSSTDQTRLTACAIRTDKATGDSWVMTDSGPASDALILPLVTTGQTDVFVTNTSSSVLTFSMEVVPASVRRRAVRSASVEAPDAALSTSLQPMETSRMPISGSSGYARINAPPGSVTAAARITMSHAPKVGLYGSAVPVLTAAAAIPAGQSKRFAGVDDASNRSVSSHAASTSRSSLTLIETAGASATVRVTVHYAFAGGALITANAVASRDYPVGSHQTLIISDVGRAVIGAARDSYGDLHNMQVDVAVVAGNGRVLLFLTSVDNSSGDLIVRSE